MPFPRPTLTTLQQQVLQAINAGVAGADALLRFSNLGAIANAQAGLAYQHYGYLDYISLQTNPFTATDEFLAAWGALKNIVLLQATQASGNVTFPATNGAVTIPIGAIVTRSDSVVYTVTAIASQTSTSITATILAEADTTGLTGAFGNSASGTTFTLGQAILGITSAGTSGIITGGSDIEAESAFRSRIILAYQNTPQGGAQQDYVAWALQFAGITRAWCAPLLFGAGTVAVYIMLDVANAAFNGLPQGVNGGATLETRTSAATGDQLNLANYLYPIRPSGAIVSVLAPTLTPIPMSIKGVAVANRTAVSAALENYLNAIPVIGGIVELNLLWSSIASADTIDDYIILSPTVDIQLATGALPVLGTVIWS